MAQNIEFYFVHSGKDKHKELKNSTILKALDPRLLWVTPGCEVEDADFAKDAAFFRGVIVIRWKK
jgi:hypothetical protein